jgi:dienelactone hydrolase
MERKKASDFDPQPLSLFDRYVHGGMYPKTNHGFHNDTTPPYDAEAAKLAWQRTIDHFNKTLKS